MVRFPTRLVFILVTLAFVLLIVRLLDAAVGRFTTVPELKMWPASSSFEHISDEFRYTININSLQLRSPEIPYKSKAKKVFVIGDSFVYGSGVARGRSRGTSLRSADGGTLPGEGVDEASGSGRDRSDGARGVSGPR